MSERRTDRRAARRRRKTIRRVLPLVRAVGPDLAAEALHLLAAGWTPADVARVIARRADGAAR